MSRSSGTTATATWRRILGSTSSLRRWEAPSPVSEEFTGKCFHTWRVRVVDDEWRVAAQMVERFTDLNDNAKRLFATPEEGLDR